MFGVIVVGVGVVVVAAAAAAVVVVAPKSANCNRKIGGNANYLKGGFFFEE